MARSLQQPPKLSIHATGVFFCHWGGKNHYFTKDEKASRLLHAESVKAWSQWKQTGIPARPKGVLTVAELGKLFLAGLEADYDDSTITYYRKHLARFLNTWHATPAGAIASPHLQALKTDLKRKGYADKTINHDLLAVKRMYNWADEMGYLELPKLRGARAIRLPPPMPTTLSPARVRLMLAMAAQPLGDRCDLRTRARLEPEPANPQLPIWLTLNYLALLRPSEVVRLVHGEGQWLDGEEGIFVLNKGKMDKRSQVRRHLVLSPQALEVLKRARPTWSRLDSYSAAVRRYCGPGGPKLLQKSAGSHLLQQGAARADIDLILGHMPSRVSLTYVPIEWQPLRAIAAGLRL